MQSPLWVFRFGRVLVDVCDVGGDIPCVPANCRAAFTWGIGFVPGQW
jgi:hypothetical protein